MALVFHIFLGFPCCPLLRLSGRSLAQCFAWFSCAMMRYAVLCAVGASEASHRKRAIFNIPWLSLVFPCFSWVSVLSLAGSCCAPLRVPWHCVLCGSCMLCCALLCRAAARASEASRRERAVFYILCLDIGFSCFSLVAPLSLHVSCFAPLGDLWHFVFCS